MLHGSYKGNKVVRAMGPIDDGESLLETEASDWVHGYNVNYYDMVDGVFTPKSQETVDEMKAAEAKSDALTQVTAEIEEKKKEENLKDFPYNGVDFIADQNNIQATQNQCLTMQPEDPIPTFVGTEFEGCWSTNGQMVPFTVAEFLDFATAFFMRGSRNFTTYATHLMNINSLETAEEILNYDYSQGWE